MIEELLAYQQKDAELNKIEKELSSSEARKKAVVAKKYLEGVEESVKNLDARAEKLIEVYQTAVAEQAKLQEFATEFEIALENAQDSSALSYLIKKIDDVSQKVKNLGSQIEKLSAEIQAVIKKYAGIKATTKSMQAQYSENGKAYQELQLSVKAEREKITKELAELEKKVDPALMKKYKEKRNAKIFPVIFESTGNVCGACHMEVSMLEASKLKQGEILECAQCGRLMYVKK